MGIMDKVKGLLKGRETQVKSGIDTVSDKAEKAVGSKYAAQVDAVSDRAKDAVDTLSKDGTATPSTPATPATPPAAAAPATPVPPADAPPT